MINVIQFGIDVIRSGYDYMIETLDFVDDNLNDLYWWLEEKK